MIAEQTQRDPHNDRSPSTSAPSPPGARALRRFVALRTKTLILLILTILGLLTALYIPLRLIVLGSFLDLEAQTTRTEVERAGNALQTAITKLDDSTTGYATWDNTYAFVQDHDERYLDVDLADPSFPAEDINLALIVDNAGQVVAAKAYDLAQQRNVPVVPFFLQPSVTQGNLFKHTTLDSSMTGFVMLPEGPMLVASRPILTSDKQGPIRGTLLMGRFLDASLIEQLAEATHLNLAFFQLDDPQRPPETRVLSGAGATITRPLSEESIAGMTVLPDAFGRPSLILRVETPRNIYAQGLTTVNYFTIALIVVALASLVVSVLGLERMVLARIGKLDTRAHTIGESGDISLRMEEIGNDELTRLSQSINGMLAALEHAQTTGKQAEQARAQTQEELLRAREQFSQMLVHDLKNPLTAIKGYLDLLNMTSLDEEQHTLIQGVYRGTSNTLALVTQILDTARLSEGRLELRREEVDIEALLHECARELRPWADLEEKPIAISVAPEFPLLKFDMGLLRRVLVNLTSNAIKHTPPQTAITLGADIAGTTARIFVRDSGPGIPRDVREQLFQRFGATASTSERQSNTGLGLTFCKLAVEAHDGTISVESGPHQGTTFTIALPLETLDSAAAVVTPLNPSAIATH
jgi:signal transduction histidine kinase